ncbi:hypothetical protein LTR84_009634 [Exophiala bonariae]|uniref:Uncharacterized protein n=1 Tax=Exophiala bonariae TaxID=1690606 RepID=A0AAV9NJA1_9EURO|nr:hypothetical protein LTR84_009634 [Exophiala bonariae]
MPHEIADSDAESDFNSPQKLLVTLDGAHEAGIPSVASQINFEDYMDPTQRLSFSSNLQSGEKATNSTNSTIRLFDGMQDAHDALNASPSDGRSTDSMNVSSIMRSKKRAHSVMHESSHTSDFDAPITASKVKRTKTYGHRSKTDGSEHNDLFAASLEPPFETANISAEQRTADKITPKTSMYPDEASDPDIPSLSTADYPKQISFFDHSMPNSLQNITTSTASIGGYASINLNYRGSGEVDVNSNPFGSVSQVSLDEGVNPVETERATSMFYDDRSPLLPDQQREDLYIINETNSLPQPLSVGPSWEHPPTVSSPNDGNPPRDGSTNVQDKNDWAVSTSKPISMTRTPTVTEDPVPTKKRGRKPKNATAPTEPPTAIVPDQAADEQSLPDLEPIRRSRQGTIDSVSATSQASSSSRKRKRGKSKHLAKPDEAADSQSPVKQLTSELNLSDEQFIGLPKESYKPRPSRSRSKKVMDEDEVLASAKTVEVATETPAKNKTLSMHLSPQGAQSSVTTGKSSTKKSGRKAKVKRAKTAGVALKLAEPMISEGEEDVVWMDSKPAPVKLELPRDLKVVKKENNQNVLAEDALRDESGPTQGRTTSITIEIPPVLNESTINTASKPAPKKRGRKPKKPQPDTSVDADQANNEVLPAEDDRKPLAEKSSNILRSKARSSTPKAPTVSPLSSPEPEPETVPQQTTTPAKNTTPTKAIAVEKGPTKHSPINPPSLPGSVGKKIIYRIGLSRRQHIPSLLRRVQRDKAPPKIVVAKEKEKKKKNAGDNGSDDDVEDRREMRGADGMLVEWGD